MINVVFAGTSNFACPYLESLLGSKDFNILAVITGSDKKVWRWWVVTQSRIKQISLFNNLKVLHPNSKAEFTELIKELAPDMLIVVAYGMIITKEALSIAKFNINVHWSLLPKFRWASPVQSCILAWESESWISIMNMEAWMDTWWVYKVLKCHVDPSDTSESLFNRLKEFSSQFPQILIDIYWWKLALEPQDTKNISYCSIIHKEDWLVQWWLESSKAIISKLKAFTPWPWIYTYYKGKLLKILSATGSNAEWGQLPWEVYQLWHDIFIKSAHGSIKLNEVQLEGKSKLEIHSFCLWQQSFIWSTLWQDW